MNCDYLDSAIDIVRWRNQPRSTNAIKRAFEERERSKSQRELNGYGYNLGERERDIEEEDAFWSSLCCFCVFLRWYSRGIETCLVNWIWNMRLESGLVYCDVAFGVTCEFGLIGTSVASTSNAQASSGVRLPSTVSSSHSSSSSFGVACTIDT